MYDSFETCQSFVIIVRELDKKVTVQLALWTIQIRGLKPNRHYHKNVLGDAGSQSINCPREKASTPPNLT